MVTYWYSLLLQSDKKNNIKIKNTFLDEIIFLQFILFKGLFYLKLKCVHFTRRCLFSQIYFRFITLCSYLFSWFDIFALPVVETTCGFITQRAICKQECLHFIHTEQVLPFIRILFYNSIFGILCMLCIVTRQLQKKILIHYFLHFPLVFFLALSCSFDSFNTSAQLC